MNTSILHGNQTAETVLIILVMVVLAVNTVIEADDDKEKD
ncbi:381_t:CDS:2 [Entrophospora sp. SA101]|nr:381_t:CDS:2 [Entrophospora sp. SA101]